MSAGSHWYQDEDGLLGALRTRPAAAQAVPEIPGYRNLEELRRGGQGVVYTAEQVSTRRQVAIKVLLGGSFASLRDRRRFEREIDVVAGLRHPAIVRLYDCGLTTEQYPYYVMEYLDGVGLDELLSADESGAPQPFGEIRTTVRMFARVCDAVGYAHRHAVIHRDLKPSNIRINRAGEAFVLDFGLARASGQRYEIDDSGVPVSMTGEFMGSLPWASPEQAEGQPGRIDVRSDVYSLGVMLFQLLTGQFPYPVVGPFREVLNNILEREPQRIRALRPEIDDELATIVNKCLAKDPERRYQTAGDLARDLRHYLDGEPIEAKRDSAWYAISNRLRRYRIATRVASGFFVVALGAALVMSFLWQRALLAEQQANQARSAEVAARDQAERKARIASEVNEMLRRILSTPVESGREARVTDVLGPALAELREGTHDPEIEIPLRDTIGAAYASLGLLDQAEPLLRQAADDAARVFGPDTDQTLMIRSHVAWLLYLQGAEEESERLYRDILAIRMRVFGPDDPQTGVCMNDLALVLEERGAWDEAEDLYRRSLDLAIRQDGPDSVDAINGIGNLASVLHSRGEFEAAEELARERLERARRALGPRHRDTLTAMNNLAVLLNDGASFDEALPLLREVHAQRSRQLGPDHADTIRVAQNIAYALAETGAMHAAEPLYRDALQRAERAYGDGHPLTLSIRGNLASLVLNLGRLEDAAVLQRAVLAARLRQATDDHPDVVMARNNLATILLTQRKFEEGAAVLADLVNVIERTQGPEAPATLTAKMNYAAALRELGDTAAAAEVARAGLAGRLRLFGPEHPATFEAEWELINIQMDEGKIDEALAGFEDLRRRAPGVYGSDHFYLPVLRGAHAQALLLAGHFAEAEQLLEEAHAALIEHFGREHFVTQAQVGRLVWLYELTGRQAQADEARKQLDARQRRKIADERERYARLGLPPTEPPTPE